MFDQIRRIVLTNQQQFVSLKEELSLVNYIIDCVWDNAIGCSGARFIDGKGIIENFPSLSAAQENCYGVSLVLEQFQVRCSFELIRCFRDNILQSLFLLENTYLDYVQRIIDDGYTSPAKNSKERAIDHFYEGRVANEDKKNFFDYSRYIEQLCKNEKIKQLYEQFFAQKFKSLEKELNDYVHNNSAFPAEYKSTENTAEINRTLSSVQNDIELVVDFFLSCLVVSKATILQSDRFISEYEEGLISSDSDLKYEIDGFINYYMFEKISQNKGLSAYLKANVTDGMKLKGLD